MTEVVLFLTVQSFFVSTKMHALFHEFLWTTMRLNILLLPACKDESS